MDDATALARGGAVREALIYGFPKLATLIDTFFKKLSQETKVSTPPPAFPWDTSLQRGEVLHFSALAVFLEGLRNLRA